jgi:hypothetical protein
VTVATIIVIETEKGTETGRERGEGEETKVWVESTVQDPPLAVTQAVCLELIQDPKGKFWESCTAENV